MAVGINDRLSTFFKTFTAFKLFRESHFPASVRNIESNVQLTALLAAMLTFSRKSVEFGDEDTFSSNTNMSLSSSHYNDLAVYYVDKAIAECSDDPPPLCVLQALLLVTHWLLIRRVHGRAWRSMGLCIRIAYELRLHTIDRGGDFKMYSQAPERWCEDEERRRTWWAIWEMDVFASVLYRLPCTISWSNTQVWLPAPDENWLQSLPQNSCCLDSGLASRIQKLQASGNESPKAWFIVLNSLMAEGHAFGSHLGNGPSGTHTPTLGGEQYPSDNRAYLERLMNAIQVCTLAIPSKYKYRGQYLDFDTLHDNQRARTSTLRTQCVVYELALMQEVAKLMALKHTVFENGIASLLRRAQRIGLNSQRGWDTGQVLDRYFQASHAVFNLLSNSHEAHLQYVNPFIAHAAWMAATVQLLQHESTVNETRREVIKSRFEVLKALHRQWVERWSMSEVPLQHLDILEGQLKKMVRLSRRPMEGQRVSSPAPAPEALPVPFANNHVGVYPLTDEIQGDREGPQAETREPEPQMLPMPSQRGFTSMAPSPPAIEVNASSSDLADPWMFPEETTNFDGLDSFSFPMDDQIIGEVSSYLENVFCGPYVG
jgi:hypothetical protein